jgi:hypothetical protein
MVFVWLFQMILTNQLFNTRPLLVHAHGAMLTNPAWPRIKQAALSVTPRPPHALKDLTVITCNNGNNTMGLFERSAYLHGIPIRVYGMGINPWINSRDKPRFIHEALASIESAYVMYADSRDVVIVGDLDCAVERFVSKYDCGLLFGADRMNWPALPGFRHFESSIAPSSASQFRYLNGGTWIGKTVVCRQFFSWAINTPAVPEAPDSEQGILKRLFPQCYPYVQLDYRCELFQNIGYLYKDVFALDDGTGTMNDDTGRASRHAPIDRPL